MKRLLEIIQGIAGTVAGGIALVFFIAVQLFLTGLGIVASVWFFLKVVSWFR